MCHVAVQEPQLQEATGSEPLSLEEDFAMQRSWRDDEDSEWGLKCRRERDDEMIGKQVIMHVCDNENIINR